MHTNTHVDVRVHIACMDVCKFECNVNVYAYMYGMRYITIMWYKHEK